LGIKGIGELDSLKGLEADRKAVPAEVDTNIPDYKRIEDHVEAKRVMKEYLESVMEQAAPFAGEETKTAIAEAKDVLSDERFMLQKGLRSLADKDARVGSKSKTSQFFGYKDEYIMTTDERIITAVDIHSGEYADGAGFDGLLERTKEAGIKPTEVYGDKAYFRKDILDTVSENRAEAYIPISASAYKVDEELYRYNKDSDQWFCIMGNHTVRKEKKTCRKHGKPFDYYVYTFQNEGCADCPHRKECFGSSKGKTRRMHVSLNTAGFYEISQRQKTAEFREKYKKRAAHEWKNGEQKRFHGLARARGFGLKSVSIQAKLTAIAVNLKRIAAIFGGKAPNFLRFYKLPYLFIVFRLRCVKKPPTASATAA
jgi:hypothetical protein